MSDTIFVYDLSVNSVNGGFDVKLFPNPTTGQFTISGGNFYDDHVYVDVYDMLGRKVFSEKQEPKNGMLHVSMDLENKLAPGKYIVKIQTTQGPVNLPFSLVR